MRRLDWFLAAIVASFLLAVAVIETTSVSVSAASYGMAHASGVGEVAMRRLVSHLPHPTVLSFDPR
ncbi:MAG TPA: hypothetical protein VKQ70_18180 [Caulobacteraceae bacterium]|jgi:hypothetical protein|nr:hypothetical protein [Caulobacteraceae bacterium]